MHLQSIRFFKQNLAKLFLIIRLPVNSPILLKRFEKINGAGEGIRTLDPNLGKVVLYP